jgi:CRISPR-associated protein Cmr4
MTVKTIFWQAITPIHTGVGQTSASVIDLPIAREIATNYPVLPASSIKGVLRDGRSGLEAYGFVGKETDELDENGKKKKISQAAELTFTDARILCLPVRSYKGTYALLTCPLILERFNRDQTAFGLTLTFPNIAITSETHALVTSQTLVYNNQKVILEDIDLTAEVSPAATTIGSSLAQQLFSDANAASEQSVFLERFAIVHNDVFAFFSETAMEVSARIALDSKTKTVNKEIGALWYEEAVPAEAIFTSFAASTKRDFTELENRKSVLQIGGKASVGRGLLRMMVR